MSLCCPDCGGVSNTSSVEGLQPSAICTMCGKAYFTSGPVSVEEHRVGFRDGVPKEELAGRLLGMRVRIREGENPRPLPRQGETGVVTEVRHLHCRVELDKDGGQQWFPTDWLETV